ncbi:MAG: hypothetical protein JOZ41_06495 [Chloroflexi bacterium]|nr:hypothetical protein [Chloroflexota bacterium]
MTHAPGDVSPSGWQGSQGEARGSAPPGPIGVGDTALYRFGLGGRGRRAIGVTGRAPAGQKATQTFLPSQQ